MEKKPSMIRLDRKNFIRKLDNIYTHYEIVAKPVGKGACGEVYKCTHRITREQRAIKVISKIKVHDVENFLFEVEYLRQLVPLSTHLIGPSEYHSTV
jgi:serine/threonine protein kinase